MHDVARYERPEPGSGAKIVVYPFEHIDSIARRLKKATQKSDILTDARRHQHFVPRASGAESRTHLSVLTANRVTDG
jgi:ribosomal protein S21